MIQSKSRYYFSTIGFAKYIFTFVMGLFFIACSSIQSNSDILSDQKEEIQQVIKNTKGIQNLENLLQKYIQDKNLQAEMLIRMELGKQYRESSKFKEAIDNHKTALLIAEQLKDTVEIIQISNQQGTNFRRIGSNDRGAELHYQALYFCDAYSDQTSDSAKKNRVVSLNGLGNAYLSLDDLELAESMFRQALQGEKELNSDLGQAINYANIGTIKEIQNNLDSATTYYHTSLEYNLKAKSDLGIALCYNHLGDIAEKQSQWSKAISAFMHAYEIMVDNPDRYHWLESCINLARVNLKANEMKEAQKYLTIGIETATDIDSKEQLSSLLMLKSNYEEKRGNIVQAFQDYKESTVLANSSNNELIQKNIQNLRVQYEKDKRDNEISNIQQTYKDEHRAKRIILYSSIFALLISLFIIGDLIYTARLRIRSQKIMQEVEKKREIYYSNITHEFRTPLTLILGVGQQIEKGEIQDAEELKTSGKMIVRQGNNLLQLTNQLLDISRIRSKINKPKWQTNNIVPFIRMIVENLQEQAQEKRIELRYESEQNNIQMDFVPDYIQKIIYSLVGNSIKHTDQYGKITIFTALRKEQLLMTVKDTGEGFSKESLSYAFKPFHQPANESDKIGTGVSLALVNQIVQELEGTIEIDGEVNDGAMIIITLPIKKKEETLEISANENNDDSNEIRTHVLIVEDNLDVAYYIGSILKDKYQITHARNGVEGLLKANELVPDLIITDIMMPEKNGYELCEEIRKSELLNHIPIIIVSARTNEEERIRGIKAGANAYLFKPFNADELKIQIAQLLERKKTLLNKYSQRNDDSVQTGKLTPSDQDFINKLNDLIHAQMKTGELNAENIASMMYMSRSQLNRKLMAIVGQNITNYSLQLRISKAKRMLDTDVNTPIGEIALACGFEDVSYFSRVFKQICQMTPSQYRKRI